MNLNLYLVKQNVNNGYDTYDSMVVVAKNADDAKRMHPCPYVTHLKDDEWMGRYTGGDQIGQEYIISSDNWIPAYRVSEVFVKFLGSADPIQYQKPQVIITSFNAG
jgi:hypothetical protein